MKISFFRFNVEPHYWEAVEDFLKNNEASEYDLRNCLKHTSTNLVIEKCSRFYSDEVIDLKDSYSIQSQRYVNFKDKLDFFYTPPEIIEKGFEEKWKNHINEQIKRYSICVENGINPEDARFNLPVTFFSNVKMTLQGDKLLDFVIYNYYYQRYDEYKEVLDKFLNSFDKKYQILIDNIMRVVKTKANEFKNFSKASRLWRGMFKPGEFGIILHNDMVMESSIGASICYRFGAPSEYIDKFDEQKQQELLKKIVSSKHESVTEHAYVTIQTPISKIIHSHIHRHRISKMSYTNFLDAVKNFSYIMPPDIKAKPEIQKIFDEGMQNCKSFYDELVAAGVSPENASYAMPNATKIDVVITTNIRDVKHILRTRLCERAQWEIRAIAYKIFENIYPKSEIMFSDLGPSCYFGKCKEGEFSCGKPHIFREFVTGLKEVSAAQE